MTTVQATVTERWTFLVDDDVVADPSVDPADLFDALYAQGPDEVEHVDTDGERDRRVLSIDIAPAYRL